jgi:hypothetical protein
MSTIVIIGAVLVGLGATALFVKKINDTKSFTVNPTMGNNVISLDPYNTTTYPTEPESLNIFNRGGQRLKRKTKRNKK